MEEEKKVEVLEEKKKSNGLGPGFMVVLVVLFLVGGVLGFAASKILDEPSKEDTTKEKEIRKDKKEEKEEELDTKSSLVTSLYENITTANNNYCGYYGLFTDQKMTINSIAEETQGQIMLGKLYRDLYKTENNVTTGKTYTKEEIEKVYKQLFGKDYKVNHGDIKACPSFSYDEGTEKYTIGEHNCGGTCGPYTTHGKIESAVKKGDEVRINVRMVFSDFDNQLFYDYQRTQKIENINPDNSDGSLPNIDYSKATLYKATFKSEDGNYVFVSVEPIK